MMIQNRHGKQNGAFKLDQKKIVGSKVKENFTYPTIIMARIDVSKIKRDIEYFFFFFVRVVQLDLVPRRFSRCVRLLWG